MSQYQYIDNLFRDLDEFIGEATTMAEGLPPGREKALLTASLERIRQMRPGFDAQIVKGVEHLSGMCDRQTEKAAEYKARIQEVRDMAARVQPPRPQTVTVPAVPAFTVDTSLGARLRDELLASLGKPATGATPPQPGKDIWEGWE
jgi:hypothetical protein